MSFFASSGALSLACLFLCISSCFGATAEEWRSRSIYQVVTDRFALSEGTLWMPCHTDLGPYCGGTWKGILQNLDYIQGMNFDAIWMSPIVAQLPQLTPDGWSYAGYWQQDLYTINSRYGSLDDLHALIDAIHDRGMFFMMDIVVNHMAFSGAADNVDYSILNPFDDEKYYHRYCEMDYSGKNLTSLEECWLGSWYVPLVDLRTEDKIVQDMFGDWIEEMVANYSVDGLRIDAGVNVQPDFFSSFVERAGVFATTEVYLSDDSVACQWEETAGSILNYPLYWPMTSAFKQNGNISGLVDMMESEKSNCKDTTVMGTFSENQDVPRFANHTSDLALAKNVATFVLMSDGIPIIYQGQEQHLGGGTNPFTNREALWETGLNVFAPLYQHIATLNTLRRHIFQTSKNFTSHTSDVIHQDDNSLVMSKGDKGGQVITILTNSGQDATNNTLSLDLSDLGYSSGTQLTEVLSCANYTVESSSSILVPMSAGQPLVLYPAASLQNSSLCGMGGLRFDSVPQTVTMTTYTATVNAAPTMMVSTATVPISETSTTATAASQSSATGMAGHVTSRPGLAISAAAIALTLGSGFAGGLLFLVL